MKRTLTLAGLLVGIAGLVLQFSISIPAHMATGLTLPAAMVRFFSYYTILSNLTLVLIYLASVWSADWLKWFRSPITRGMLAAVIVLVMGFYHLILSSTWQPEGLFKVADVTLHYVTPILYIIWWGAVAKHGALRWAAIPFMLLPSLIYLAYVMVRGAIITEYPYPILEADKLGYGAVAFNIVAVAIALSLLFAVVIAIDGFLARRTSS